MTAQEEATPPPPASAPGLLLDSLHIQGFRGFRDLPIPRLGRVNLVVGQNNVGKTALLEALRLYASNGSPSVIWEMLEARSEIGLNFTPSQNPNETEERILALRYLFYGRNDIRSNTQSIEIKSDNSETEGLLIEVAPNNGQKDYVDGTIGILKIQNDVGIYGQYALNKNLPLNGSLFNDMRESSYSYRYVSSRGMSNREAATLWDSIVMTSGEDEVISALSVIAQNVRRINFVEQHITRGLSSAWAQSGLRDRIPVVKIEGVDSVLPLGSMGEGMGRLLDIALALVSSANGFFIIDEIDTGLHYTVQPDMWRLIFAVARRLNVQVFATTHSWDCMEAFTKAAVEDTASDGMLISLRRRRDTGVIHAVLFDEEELGIVTDEQIEVR